MRHLALPKGWESKRIKAVRFGFINLAGRVVNCSRQLLIRLNGSHSHTAGGAPAIEDFMDGE